MAVTNILDRFIEDYEGGHPVEYAIPHSPKKVEEIEKAMRVVRKKVGSNASERMGGLRKNFTTSEIDELQKPFKEFMRNVYTGQGAFTPAMAVNENAFRSIMEGDGRIINMFETGISGADDDIESRIGVISREVNGRFVPKVVRREKAGFVGRDGFPYSYPRGAKKSMKYGFVNDGRNGANKLYGEYTLNFNPANVRDRMTVSLDDTFKDYGVALPGDESTWSNLPSYTSVNNRTYDSYKKFDLEKMKGKHNQYNELHYHGPMDLGDVNVVEVPVGTNIPDRWKMQAEINRFNIIDDNGNVLYRWGKR